MASTSPRPIAQPTASDAQIPTAKSSKKLYAAASLGLDSLSLRRKSSSPKPSPRRERFSTDISDEPITSPTTPYGNLGVSRSRTLPRMTMRRTLSLEADLALAPLPKEKLMRMRRWILALAIVNFDLDLGPVVDVLYPEATIDSARRENIAFSSFPDSAIFDSGSEVHSFRIRDPGLASHASSKSSLLSMDDSSSSPSPSPSSFSTDGFLYGYALFHQRRDSSSKRGYLQRSVVILSQHSYPSLFTACLAELAPMYFARGAPVLETACHNIANWPSPTPALACELGFMGSVLSVELPLASPHHQLRQTSSSSVVTLPKGSDLLSPEVILASLPSDPSTHLPSPLRLFAQFLPKMWSLWECLVLCEPVILFAKSPRDASLAVWWLMEILKPLPPAIDFRPYFHIHDVDFDRLLGPSAAQVHMPMPPTHSSGTTTPSAGNPTTSPRGVLLGVTNPFFETICKRSGWPHVVSLGHVQVPASVVGKDLGGNGQMASLNPEQHEVEVEGEGEGEGEVDVGQGRPQSPSRSKSMRRNSSGKGLGVRLSSPRLSYQHTRRASAGGPTAGAGGSTPSSTPKPRFTGGGAGGAAELGPLPGFHTKHQRYISKDREVLKTLEAAVGKGSDAEARAVQLLRQHFAQRASEVLVPLNRYFTSLISSSSSPNPNPSFSTNNNPKTTASLPPFLPSAFFASLKQHGSPLPFRTRAKQKEFYERWLRSPAFAVWMRERDEEARNVLGGRRA